MKRLLMIRDMNMLLLLPSLLLVQSDVFTRATTCLDWVGVDMNCVDGGCPSRCLRVTSSGECLQCLDSRFYGKQCENDCPHNCLNCRCHLNASRVICIEGCVTGKKGDNCGVDCPTSCTHCERHGDTCIGLCPRSQYFGDKCSIPCPSTCTNGCDKDTGYCSSCMSCYEGSYCNVTTAGCPLSSEPTTVHKHVVTAVGGSVSPSLPGIIMVSLAGVICLAFVGFLVWFRRKRRKKVDYNEVSTTEPQPKKRKKRKAKIINESEWEFDNTLYQRAGGIRSMPRVKLCTELKSEQSERHMKQEFEALPQPEVQSFHSGRLAENFLKNRYKDILPFDSSRVCLAVEEEEESDFINASYIDGYRQRTQYIAAQGPTKALMVDFWRMLWQGDVIKIVMLTNLVENGSVKCEMYWPSCGIDCETYGDVSVQCVEEKVFEHYTIRSLQVWKANCQTRTMLQFHYTSWPAQGVPEEVTSLIDFYKVVKNTCTDDEGPTVVHCSAGVGRTGTFLALVYLIDQARFEGRACVYTCVHDIRFQRMKMVHTKEQYIFLYRVLIGALETRGILPDNSVPVWLQCRLCWETDRQHPVVNGVLMVYNQLDRNQSSSNASLRASPV